MKLAVFTVLWPIAPKTGFLLLRKARSNEGRCQPNPPLKSLILVPFRTGIFFTFETEKMPVPNGPYWSISAAWRNAKNASLSGWLTALSGSARTNAW